MTDIAVLAALFRSADRLSSRRTLISEHALAKTAHDDLQLARPAGDIQRGIDTLVEQRFLLEPINHPGYYVTDRAIVSMADAAQLMADPQHTNPRVTWSESREIDRDRSHPLAQAQRFTIVAARSGEGAGDVLGRLGLADHVDIANHVHGNDPADIARFPINTPRMVSTNAYAGLAGHAKKSVTPAGVGYTPSSIVIVSDTALRTARDAYLIAAASRELGAGKVIVIVEPHRTDALDLMSVHAAVRAGVASDYSAPARFSLIDRPVSLAAAIEPVRDRFVEARHDNVSLAAARYFMSKSEASLVAHDSQMIRDLNLACWSLAYDPAHQPNFIELDSLEPVHPDIYSVRTGAGIRDGDTLRVDDPGSTDLVANSRFSVMNIRPLENLAIAKNENNRYRRLNLTDLHDRGVRLTLHRSTRLRLREGEPISLTLPGRGRSRGRVALVSKSSIAFSIAGEGHLQVSDNDNAFKDVRLEYASSRVCPASPASIVAARIHDCTALGSFTPGAAYTAARMVERGRLSDVTLVTEDTQTFFRHAEHVHPGDAADLDARVELLTEMSRG